MNDAWMADALCAQTEPDLFTSEIDDRASSRRAKQICALCEVRQQCLQYALDTNQMGSVWGGLTTIERGRLKRRAA